MTSKAATIARVGIRSWELPLERPLRVGGRVIERRSGLLVVIEDGEGHAGIGEVAPLPGLHVETLGAATAQLLALTGKLEGALIPDGCPALAGAFESWLGGLGLYPTVRAGVEGAVLTLLADRAGTDLPHLLAGEPAEAVRINGLLDGSMNATLDAAVALADQGYSALKIKVGRRDAGDEAELVLTVRALVGPAVALRLDANRAWDLATAEYFAERVAPAGIEYLEEPLRDHADLEDFVAQAVIPIALDETLLGYSPQAPPSLGGIAALILKTSVLGGYERAAAWARFARGAQRVAVVSAAFPSAVGMALDVAFAAAYGDGTTHGLGTSGAFSGDLWRTPLGIENGVVDARRLPFRPGDFDLGKTDVLR